MTAIDPVDVKSARDTGSRLVAGRVVDAGHQQPAFWHLAEEVPVSIMVNSQPVAVLMATPADLEDLAIGFLLSEGLVGTVSEMAGVLLLPFEGGVGIDVAVPGGTARPVPDRAIAARAGCGICGVREVSEVVRPLPRLQPSKIAPHSVKHALACLRSHQPMKQVNHSVHAAAWCTVDGSIELVREDVGRHNALDKLIGAIARSGRSTVHGFAAMSSRCSFELVQKAAIAGLGVLATMSAPTSLAVQLASRAGLVLAARAGDGVMFFDPQEDCDDNGQP